MLAPLTVIHWTIATLDPEEPLLQTIVYSSDISISAAGGSVALGGAPLSPH